MRAPVSYCMVVRRICSCSSVERWGRNRAGMASMDWCIPACDHPAAVLRSFSAGEGCRRWLDMPAALCHTPLSLVNACRGSTAPPCPALPCAPARPSPCLHTPSCFNLFLAPKQASTSRCSVRPCLRRARAAPSPARQVRRSGGGGAGACTGVHASELGGARGTPLLTCPLILLCASARCCALTAAPSFATRRC